MSKVRSGKGEWSCRERPELDLGASRCGLFSGRGHTPPHHHRKQLFTAPTHSGITEPWPPERKGVERRAEKLEDALPQRLHLPDGGLSSAAHLMGGREVDVRVLEDNAREGARGPHEGDLACREDQRQLVRFPVTSHVLSAYCVWRRVKPSLMKAGVAVWTQDSITSPVGVIRPESCGR